MILGVDPGRAKIGLAVIQSDGVILFRAVISAPNLETAVAQLLEQWEIETIALGDSTASLSARARLESVLPRAIEIRVVNETGSTLEARALYWADNPRRGWRALVPLSLQEPPEPVDDYAAAVVARRALKTLA